MSKITGYAGTYASPDTQGIYRFTLDSASGALEGPVLFREAPDAKYLSLRDGMLAAPVRRGGAAGALLLDTRRPQTAREALREAVTPCHTAQDARWVFTANFHEGCVTAYEKPDLRPSIRRDIAPNAGCHQVLPHRDLLLVPCMNLDVIRLFRRDGLAPAGEIAFPQGSGPRHGVFNKAHTRLFVAGQWSHSVFCFRAEGERFLPAGEFPALREPGKAGDETAAIRLSPDERFLYVSVRGPDVITVHRVTDSGLEPVQSTGSGGKHPRDFILSGDGRFLLAANRFGGGIVCFALDRASGRIGGILGRAELPQAVSLALDEPPDFSTGGPSFCGKTEADKL